MKTDIAKVLLLHRSMIQFEETEYANTILIHATS